MSDNFIETQYDITKKSRLLKFYESNKIFLYSTILFLIILFFFIIFYLNNEEKKKISLSNQYIQAKIYLEKEDKDEALKVLKNVVLADDPTYSTLSFFLIVNQNLITDYNELTNLLDHLLKNNSYKNEIKDLLIYKKALLNLKLLDESQLLEITKPLINSDSIWKPHALLLLGDYFLSKKEYTKAQQFYSEILAISSLHKDLYDQANSQLIISNE